MSLPFSHFRAFVGFREPNSSFKRYNNNMYLFLEHGLDFRMSRNLPKEVSFLKQQRLPEYYILICQWGYSIWESLGIFLRWKIRALKRFLLERRKPKPQESQQPIRRKENNFKSQLEFKVKPKFYIWLVERVALVFWTNHTAKLGKNLIFVDMFSFKMSSFC